MARVYPRDDGGFDAEVDDEHGLPSLVIRGYRTIAIEPGQATG
jgi:hypothetical protein